MGRLMNEPPQRWRGV